MKLTPDDPKLTAYALGELDATERAAVEAALARSPECRRAVEEIRALAGALTTELAQDAATATLAPVGRDSVEPQLERSEASAASISGEVAASRAAPFDRASSVGKWGSTESHPTSGVAPEPRPTGAAESAKTDDSSRTLGFSCKLVISLPQSECERGTHHICKKIEDCLQFIYSLFDLERQELCVKFPKEYYSFTRRVLSS